jgi:starch synthase
MHLDLDFIDSIMGRGFPSSLLQQVPCWGKVQLAQRRPGLPARTGPALVEAAPAAPGMTGPELHPIYDGRDGRSHRLRILQVTPECAPFAKVGGLGDVVPGLARTLHELGHDVRVLIPLYRRVDRAHHGVRPVGSACVHLGNGVEHWIGVHRADLGGLPVFFIDFGVYFDRDGIYGAGNTEAEYLDNAYRFALLCKAALQLCKDWDWIPSVMHLHDWPAALTAVFLKTWDRVLSPLSSTASVLTIHNIGHQGKCPAHAFAILGVGGEHWPVLEDYGRINLLKGGIRFADAVTTVSPCHLREILSPEGGHGLAPFLAARRDDLTGILNGADYQHWNPETDPYLPARYTADDISGKKRCKEALQVRLGLELREDLPLFGMITRLVLQKGIDLLRVALPAALERLPMQLALLGAGEPEYEGFFAWLRMRFPGKVGCHIGYDESLAHLIEGGSDFFLMPSLYEPCGLNQIYSMRYGTIPVVRATGGMLDSVEDFDPENDRGTGFLFQDPTGPAVLGTLQWVVSSWQDRRPQIEAMRLRGMARDFSWTASARRYIEVYQRALARRAAWG